MLNNKNLYPTSDRMIYRMLGKVQGKPRNVLDPNAGFGHILEYIKKDSYVHNWRSEADVSAIEIDPNLQSILRGKGIKVIDTDFLAYAGPDKFDLIIMNPPFDDGDKHLSKAIEILYRGEIVCLLNAETIRNPYTNIRKLLSRRLDELGATIEFVQDAFVDADRETAVEVALIYIKVDRQIEDDLFADANDHAARAHQTINDKNEVSTGKTVAELVAEYNEIIQFGTDTIVGYYKNSRKVAGYLSLKVCSDEQNYSHADLTGVMQIKLNALLVAVRKDFWRKALDLDAVRKRLTKKKQDEFEEQLKHRCHMDFTESNIHQFVLNIINSSEQTLTEAVLDIFDMFTTRHCWHGEVHEKNIHYFNGWKTNKSYKVGKKIIIPGGRYGESFMNWNRWQLSYDTARTLEDIDKVMNYFDGMGEYVSMSSALEKSFKANESRFADQRNIESTYFIMTPHKKGTLHLTFKSADILRRFNVIACRGKNWLPGDFGSKSYKELTAPEQAVVDSFDGSSKVYDQYVNQPMFRVADNGFMQIGFEYKEAA
jgi:hypothetical protein